MHLRLAKFRLQKRGRGNKNLMYEFSVLIRAGRGKRLPIIWNNLTLLI